MTLRIHIRTAGPVGLAAVLACFAACNKILDVENPSQISVDSLASKQLVDVQVTKKTRTLGLPELRETAGLEDMIVLKKGNRLSITPVDTKHWKQLLKLLG